MRDRWQPSRVVSFWCAFGSSQQMVRRARHISSAFRSAIAGIARTHRHASRAEPHAPNCPPTLVCSPTSSSFLPSSARRAHWEMVFIGGDRLLRRMARSDNFWHGPVVTPDRFESKSRELWSRPRSTSWGLPALPGPPYAGHSSDLPTARGLSSARGFGGGCSPRTRARLPGPLGRAPAAPAAQEGSWTS